MYLEKNVLIYPFLKVRKNKKWIVVVLLFVLIIIATLVTKYNYRYYQRPIGKIVSVSNKCIEKGTSESDALYLQNITLKIMNGKHKDETYHYNNKYYYSQFNTIKYNLNQEVFLELKETGDDINVKMRSIKIDYYSVFIILLFVSFIILVSGKRSLLIIITLLFNILVFLAGVNGFIKGTQIELITIGLMVLFVTSTLFLLNGFTKMSMGAVLSSLTTLVVILLIYEVVLNSNDRPMFELIEFVSGNEPLQSLFLSSILMGSLGAIMDVAITINSSVLEIIQTAKNLTVKSLINSVREISYDIMGTMINVLFFSFFSGGIPMFLLKIKNGYSLSTILNIGMVFDSTRFLIGAIGIVAAVPISGVISILLHRKEIVRDDIVA